MSGLVGENVVEIDLEGQKSSVAFVELGNQVDRKCKYSLYININMLFVLIFPERVVHRKRCTHIFWDMVLRICAVVLFVVNSRIAVVSFQAVFRCFRSRKVTRVKRAVPYVLYFNVSSAQPLLVSYYSIQYNDKNARPLPY